jgi:hypothetical protein
VRPAVRKLQQFNNFGLFRHAIGLKAQAPLMGGPRGRGGVITTFAIIDGPRFR